MSGHRINIIIDGVSNHKMESLVSDSRDQEIRKPDPSAGVHISKQILFETLESIVDNVNNSGIFITKSNAAL